MRDQTRKLFKILCTRLAAGFGVADVSQQFSVSPSVQQLLKDKIVEASTFLPRVNFIIVDELKGENILAGASGPVTGRTDTTGDAERTPRDVLGLEKFTYELAATQSDVYMRYNTVDAWAKFKDMAERYSRYVWARNHLAHPTYQGRGRQRRFFQHVKGRKRQKGQKTGGQNQDPLQG